MNSVRIVDDNEVIARILHKDWVVDGQLQVFAFVLRPNESYISVNRPSIETFKEDVSDFVGNHPEFRSSEEVLSCKLARMSVKDVRTIQVDLGSLSADVSVDVEPRSLHYHSHAGIFTRVNGKNLKGGPQTADHEDEYRILPVRAIHQKVQHALLALSKLEECQLDKSEILPDFNN